jgi:Icc protein
MSGTEVPALMTTTTTVLDILQLSDPHLFAYPATQLKGVRTFDTFQRTLKHALAALDPDIILLTGDLSQDCSAQTYARIRQLLEPLKVPVFSIPGNHDDPQRMVAELGHGHFHYCEKLRHENWLLCMLDTCDGARGGGRLGEEQLVALDAELESTDAEHVLVCLHHHPVPIGSAWLDAVGLDDGDELLAIIGRHTRVCGLLWGHVHQRYDGHAGALRLMGTPSTCYQFVPGRDDLALDDLGPGYRRIQLRADGRIDTHVTQLEP